MRRHDRANARLAAPAAAEGRANERAGRLPRAAGRRSRRADAGPGAVRDARRRGALGRGRGRAPVPGPRVLGRARADGEAHYLLEDVGPGTRRLCELRAGEGLWVLGPLGRGFAPPHGDRRALLVGGGVGIAPLAILQDTLTSADGVASTVLLGFRDGRPRRRARAAERGERSPPTMARSATPGSSPSC